MGQGWRDVFTPVLRPSVKLTGGAAHIARMSPKQKKIAVIAAVVVAVVIIVIAIASCSPRKERPESVRPAAGSGYMSSAYASCVPPMACGPHYASYVPPYFLAHPSFIYLSPYRSYYTPSFNGRSYTAARTPAGRAPVTSRTTTPYPPGYKPVPGDFRPPTAPAAVPSQVPTSAPAPSRAPAPKTTVRPPAKKAEPAKKAPSAPKSAPRSRSGRR